MKKILVIETSPRGENSVSRKLTAEIVARLRAKYPSAELTTRDLTASPLPHIGAVQLAAYSTPAEKRDAALTQAIASSDTAVEELLGADIVVIGTPVWNFSIPSALKAWVDHVVRAGRTFSYTEKGPHGLVSGKEVYVAKSSGAVFSEGPMKSLDHAEPYLRTFFSFIGIENIKFIRAEGLNDPRFQAEAYDKALKELQEAVA